MGLSLFCIAYFIPYLHGIWFDGTTNFHSNDSVIVWFLSNSFDTFTYSWLYRIQLTTSESVILKIGEVSASDRTGNSYSVAFHFGVSFRMISTPMSQYFAMKTVV